MATIDSETPPEPTRRTPQELFEERLERLDDPFHELLSRAVRVTFIHEGRREPSPFADLFDEQSEEE